MTFSWPDSLDLPVGVRAFTAIVRDDLVHSAADVVGIALHELAHDLDSLRTPIATAPAESLGEFATMTADSLPATFADDKVLPDSAFNDHHGLRFHRAAIHVAYRALLLGHSGGLSLMSVPRSVKSQIALADEPRQLAHLAIGQILDSPAPSSFSRLWS